MATVVTIHQAEDGLIVDCVTVDGVCQEAKHVREIHPGDPMRHIEETLSLVGERFAGEGYTCRVTIKATHP